MPTNQQDIFQALKHTLVEEFELDPAAITPEARLNEDLDLDSIDAVDMILKIQDLTGCKVRPEDFKQVRTVGDVENTVKELLAERPKRAGSDSAA
jgi:acyl carrier protein